MAKFTKDPSALLDYTVNWVSWLATSETISSSAWLTDGLPVHDESNTSTAATVWVRGGIPGAWYRVTNRITTNQGRTNDYTFDLYVRET